MTLGAFRVSVHYEDELTEVMHCCEATLRRETAVPGT